MPPLSRSPASDEEIRIAIWLMDMVDNGEASRLSWDSAVTILTQRGLSLHQLHKIWPLADRDNKGYLTGSELTVAVRLIGWVQAGHEVTEGLVKSPGPSPKLRGITDLLSKKLPDPGISPSMRQVSMKAPKTQKTGKIFESIHNEKFRKVFLQETPIHGVLVCREQVLKIFISQFSISHCYLTQVFELVDFSKRNALDIEEFCLGMHVLEALDSSSRLVLPPTIPPDIYNQLMDLESLISKAAMPPANMGTHNTLERTANLSTNGRARLTTEIVEDMKHVRDESDTKSSPDFALLPNRVASPVSECYSSTDTAGSCRWSRCPPSSYSGSCSRFDAAPRPSKPQATHPQSSLGRCSDVPVRNQDFSAEIKSLSAQLQEVQCRLSCTMSSDKQSRLQQHYTDEIDRLTSALAQKNMQCQASQALLNTFQESAIKLTDERDSLQQVVEAQTREISEVTTHLKQAKHDIEELASTSTSPNMRILFLRASMRESRSEVEQVKKDAEKLREIVAAQKAEIFQLNAIISQQSSAVEYTQGPQDLTNDALSGLGSQIQRILDLMEQVVKRLVVDDNPAATALVNDGDKQPDPQLLPEAQNAHTLSYNESFSVSRTKVEPEPIETELDWGSMVTEWCDSLAENAFTSEINFPENTEDQDFGTLTQPDIPEQQCNAQYNNEHTPSEDYATPNCSPSTVSSLAISQDRMGTPIDVTKTVHPTLVSSPRSSSFSPPSYEFNAAYSGFYELREAKYLYQRAAESGRLAREAMNAKEFLNTALTTSPVRGETVSITYPSLSTYPAEASEFPPSFLSRPPDYVVDSASSLHEMGESKRLYSKAIETGRLTRAALSSSLSLENMPEWKPDGVSVGLHTTDRGKNSQDPQARPLPALGGDRYPQDTGHFTGRVINATDEEEHLGLLARQHQLEGAAINAMDDAHHLRNLVQWQENEIMELNNRLEGRSNLVVNNPGEAENVTDSDHGPVVHFAEEPFHWTDDQSYHRASKRKGNLFKYFVSTVFKENRGPGGL